MIRDQELYIWDYCDPSLRISSRAALSCLSIDDVYSVVCEYGYNRELEYDSTRLINFMQYE